MLVLLMMFAMASCGGAGGDNSDSSDSTASIEDCKTIGDILNLDAEDVQTAVYENNVVYAFKLGDSYYRVRATISDEDQDKYIGIDYSDEDYEDQQNAIVAPLEIDEIENLDEQILTQEERDALVGKTGQELQDEGWTYSGHDLETMEFWMNYGPFMYTVTFDGKVDEKDYDDYDDEEGTKGLKIKSVEFMMLGDATNIE